MKLIKYGVTLKRLREEDIEEVRQWRNSSGIRDKMEYRKYITPEMQKAWFEKINNLDNFHYIIIYQGKRIGLLSEKKIDFDGIGTTESGLFLADPQYHNTYVPVFISLMLIEINFYIRKGKESYIKVLRDNTSAIAYNKGLGYELCEGQEDAYNQKYVLTKDSFEKKAKKLRKAALHLSGGDDKMYLMLDEQDYAEGLGDYYDQMYAENSLIEEMKTEVPGEKIYYSDFSKIL